MSDNSTRRHTRLMEAWLHRWSDDRARELREQNQKEHKAETTTNVTAGKPKQPSL